MKNPGKSNHQKFQFLWGVATSAFQMEGHLRNDMTEWEKQGYFNQNGKSPVHGIAANHWKSWKDDFQLLKQLNVNAYSFSMDWGRIQPEKGCFDMSALSQYDRMVDELLELKKHNKAAIPFGAISKENLVY